MKVRRRSIPMDMLSVESKDRQITITTCHHMIHLSAYAKNQMEIVAHHELTFDQLFELLAQLPRARRAIQQ